MSTTSAGTDPSSTFRFHLEAETVLLLFGTVVALCWANLGSVEAYHHAFEWPHINYALDIGFLPPVKLPGKLHFLITDGLMAFFFALAAKEVFESFLPGGALSSFRKAALPLLATLGGMVGPAALFVGGVALLGADKELYRGWAIPCATDIAFSYAIARTIFGSGHPAIAFLLLLAIADDGAGLIILAAFYTEGFQGAWLFVSVGAIVLALLMNRFGVRNFWWFILIPGAMCWLSFQGAGIHAALGLVPIVFCMPHSKSDVGLFADQEMSRPDALSRFEEFFEHGIFTKVFPGKWLSKISWLDLIVLFFALSNAGVSISNGGEGTFLVLFGLVVGKPVGIALFTWLGQRGLGLRLPERVTFHDIWIIGFAAGIGFTVALFVSVAAYGDPQNAKYVVLLDEVKIGALGSLIAGVFAVVLARHRTAEPAKVTPPQETAEESFAEEVV